MNDDQLLRYSRHIFLDDIGIEGQQKILDAHAVIVGAGPAGIFTALELFKQDSNLKVLLVDSGKGIKERNCPARKLGRCVNCNPCAIMSGWAGAGDWACRGAKKQAAASAATRFLYMVVLDMAPSE